MFMLLPLRGVGLMLSAAHNEAQSLQVRYREARSSAAWSAVKLELFRRSDATDTNVYS